MQPGDIISYRDMCNNENVETLQRGMNYRLGTGHSVLLMSRRANAPYEDEIEDEGRTLIYEGHDVPRSADIPDPKIIDQPMITKSGSLTENGKFYEAAQRFRRDGVRPEIVRVYEKIQSGIWAFNGEFKLIDAWQTLSHGRSVFKYRLEAIAENETDLQEYASPGLDEHSRVIPSAVKAEVWKRDNGKCVNCGSSTNLHFDHIIPYSKGGTSLSVKNIQILCINCNLAKRDKIE